MHNPQTLHTYQNKQRSERKHLRHKHTTSAKTRRGFILSKDPNQKGHNKCKAKANRIPRKNQKMDARKGGDVFSTRTFGTHHSIYPKQKELRPSRTTARKKGGRRFFTKNKVSAHCLVRKQILYRNKHSSKKSPPGNDSLGREGDVFQEPP